MNIRNQEYAAEMTAILSQGSGFGVTVLETRHGGTGTLEDETGDFEANFSYIARSAANKKNEAL